ncbi:hypothetical protein FG93_05474 [Bosea sp. LC85]|uniref:hypothetical protein n=1 Tax=Bosea sp. LC85 TaxID=1502851 RepID=UPI0004E41188|nr:hypothetical protein [Bosea sp. LC85]KFC63964.1 hypothetical protein FG93_05474 [Bosea sp. LC85]
MSDILGTLATSLAKQGAPLLGGLIGTALGGPVGAAVGGLAGKAIESLADAFGVDPTPEAVKEAVDSSIGAADVIAEAEAQARAMLPIWQIEATRASEAQTVEIERGFGAWQFWRGAWQGLIITGWAVILLIALLGGNLGIRPLLPLPEMVSAWGSVTLTWLAVFNGGHTLKEIAPTLGFGRRGAR